MKRAGGLVVAFVGLTAVVLGLALKDGNAGSAQQTSAAPRVSAPGVSPSPSVEVRPRARPALPIVKQVFRNNCETAALSMLLVWDRIRVDQVALQRDLVRSGPLDPYTSSAGLLVWGDPDKGYVGRAEGGGVAGGFGVYQGPIRRLAAKRGARLVDLSRVPPAKIYARLARGVPVMVWIGLSDGPYRRWVTPAGKQISANFGEHTVVLTGIRGGNVAVNDPLVGRRTTWTKADFETMWLRLGRRALSY